MKRQTNISAILLAGGTGSRMQETTPKQFLPLGDKPMARYSFDLFLEIEAITEIVVVCDPLYKHFFTTEKLIKPIHFALPGKRRQDSAYNGFKVSSSSSELICVHDSARPLIDKEMVLRVLQAGTDWGAATVGMPIKFTIKESSSKQFVRTTPDRNHIWEIQTPQVLHRDILSEGFLHANKNDITVTDDVSLAELIGKQVKLVEGSYNNLKITTPLDFLIAKQLIKT